MTAESDEVREEGWWRRGGGFRWCWPHLDVFHPADRSWRVGLNRYPHNVIGAFVIAFGRGWGIRWKDSRRA